MVTNWSIIALQCCASLRCTKICFIYLAAPGVCWGTFDLQLGLQHVGSLFVASKLLVQYLGSSSWTKDQIGVPYIGSMES